MQPLKWGAPLRVVAASSIVAALLCSASASGQDEPPPDGWTYKGALTSVLSAGNAEAFTLGLGTTIENRRGPRLLKLEAGALRTESSLLTRRAVGSAADFSIVEDRDRQKTAELYFARGRYDRAVSERFFLYGGADWLRNTFAGIDSRLLGALGAGNIWLDREDSRFRTSYAATWTFQSDVVADPDASSDFPGVRAGWEYWRQLTASTEFESVLTGDLNLEETDDVRADFLNSLTVSMSDVLALEPSLQVLWRNRPSLTEVDLFTTGGAPLGQTVLTPLDKTDLLFRLALVVTL